LIAARLPSDGACSAACRSGALFFVLAFGPWRIVMYRGYRALSAETSSPGG
jgi:membrane protein CcdC involved in cytochrome C biogenesis